MALFWIKPNQYLALDSNNRTYLKQFGIEVPKNRLAFFQYKSILEQAKAKMSDGEIPQKSFLEFSLAARKLKGEDLNNIEKGNPSEVNMNHDNPIINLWKNKKNLVIYGAPGTGKTYAVPELVVELCNPSFQSNDRVSIIKEYNRLIENGQVVFTTFHQSLDYEDFVEGLKPVSTNEKIDYRVEDGLFKQLCQKAISKEALEINDSSITATLPSELSDLGIHPDANIWKISLMGAGENEVRKDCLDNSRIRIGWDSYGPKIRKNTRFDYGGKRELNAFINKIQIGDVVLSCFSKSSIDAVGVITGDYEWEESLEGYNRVRKVKWLIKNISEDVLDLNKGAQLSQQTVYRLIKMSLQDIKDLLDRYAENTSPEPYVFVIDEINRGNVSKVLGELITLLEADKRLGEESEVRLTLPYSKEEFGIPSNVFVLATMNTADRSLENLDYALRRRFAFVPLIPHPLTNTGFNEKLFRIVSELFVKNYDGIFYKSEKPIASDYLSEEFTPADVWIGHSYFLMRDKNGIDQTTNKLKYEIIPILQEYIRDGVFKDAEKVEETILNLEELCS